MNWVRYREDISEMRSIAKGLDVCGDPAGSRTVVAYYFLASYQLHILLQCCKIIQIQYN
jgi:hypothetical protein